MNRSLGIALGVAFAAAVSLVYWLAHPHTPRSELELYGNVDLRQVDLPFNASERVTAVLVQEGDRVKQGQVLARLDTTRLEPQVAKAQADVAAHDGGTPGGDALSGARPGARLHPPAGPA